MPNNPNSRMYLKFLPKFCFFRLYPPAKIMGGSNPKKKSSSLKSISWAVSVRVDSIPKMSPMMMPMPV